MGGDDHGNAFSVAADLHQPFVSLANEMTTTTTSAHDDAAIAAPLRMAVARLARRLRQEAAEGLTPSQLTALATVERLGTPRLCDVAAAERISAPTLTKVAASLEHAGLLRRDPDPDDRRSARLAATPAGRAVLRKVRSQRTAYLEQRLATLSPAEVDALRAALPVLQRLAEDDA